MINIDIYLTGKEILHSSRTKLIEQTTFTSNENIEGQGEKQRNVF